MKYDLTIILGFLVLAFASCREQSTQNATDSVPSLSFRSSKCAPVLVLKGARNDSSFSYTFRDTLFMDCAVAANCCPDSDRFSVSASIGTDTLVITIADTARYLCRCICPYFIHIELAGLPNNHYTVRCRLVNNDAPFMSEDTLYLVDVFRTH